MARRPVQATQRRRGPSRTNWGRTVNPIQVTVAAATKVFLSGFALDNPGISETVRRTRGQIFVRSDQGAASEDQVGAFGMMKINDVALAAGAASIPGPATEASDDGWFVWQPITQMGAAATVGAGRLGILYTFDSKAMRTIEEGFGIAIMFENAHATHGLVITWAVSLLSSRA